MNLRKILTIEGIRGFAAIYVMLGHFVLLFKPYSFYPESSFIIKTMFGYGHQAVILFFIVSVFSIHYSSFGKSFDTKRSICDYFYKRIRRIYPLFFFSLLISLAVFFICGMEASLDRIILSFFFLTDNAGSAIAHPIPTNFPIWSLSYEMFYYLLYPLLFKLIKKFGIERILLSSIGVSIFFGLFGVFDISNHFSNVLTFYWTWVAGAYIAELIINKKRINTTYLIGILVTLLGLSFTLEKVYLLRDWAWAGLFILTFLSYFSKSSKLSIKQKGLNIFIGIIGISICFCLTRFENITYHTTLVRLLLVVFAFLLFILTIFSFSRIQTLIRILLKPFIRFGSYSYAIYIFHWPIIVLLINLFRTQIHASIVYMILSMLFAFVFIMSLSWLMEIKLQPIVAKWMDKLYYKKTNLNAPPLNP